jgi:hypothetical protein
MNRDGSCPLLPPHEQTSRSSRPVSVANPSHVFPLDDLVPHGATRPKVCYAAIKGGWTTAAIFGATSAP